ncbi:sialidase family protein [Roseivirga sp.]|uniref:sialidase family protein n=1 Tax=Roseivirga sp. TaxID=1964215 RepID=UPI003B8CBD53
MRQYLLLFISLLLLGCQGTQKDQYSIELINTPADENALAPRLFRSDKGQVYMSWLEKKVKNTQLKFSMLEDGSWTQPKLISEGENWFVNWADFPSIIENNGTLSAHWLEKRAEGTYDYDVKVSQSKDQGISWSTPFTPHKDSIAAEHGFVSMLPLHDQDNFLTWLDGRNTKAMNHDAHNEGHGGSGAMTIRAGIFNDNGDMLNDWELDARTCDCCQTTTALTASGPIVAYRNRSDEEIRDIYISRLIDDAWSEPAPVYNDNWKISGCPVNGPSLVANGDNVAIAWFTAAAGFGQVKMAISKNSGASFSAPTILSEGNTNGRVGTTLLENGHIIISWMETSAELASILIAEFDEDGKELNRKTIAQTDSSRGSGFPVITNIDNNLVVAWTESGESSLIKTAFITLN